MRGELERIEIPGEHEARARAWSVVARSFHERQPTRPRSQWPRVAAIAIALAALAAAALSSPGRAVLDEVREVVGVERAQPALFSLPAPGRLLVASDAGLWVVQEDGSKRLLGPYREGSWSPFGRFVVAARANELAALEADGDVRWTLARPGGRSLSWGGTENDTRIAYVDRSGLRIVAGDGTDDHLVERGFQGLTAWHPRNRLILASADEREIRVMDATGKILWRRDAPGSAPIVLEWSRSGRRLLVASSEGIHVYDASGDRPYELGPGASGIRGAALAPTGGKVAFAQRSRAGTQLWIVPRIRPDANAARRLFSGPGRLTPAAWAPNGLWIAAGWEEADQWLFVRANGSRVRAISNVSDQFRSRSFPRIEGWTASG